MQISPASMSDGDTFVAIASGWIALSALGAVIIYAHWPPVLAIVWISENLIALTLVGLTWSLNDTDKFLAFTFGWIIFGVLSSAVIYAYWPPLLSVAWIIENLLAYAVVSLSKTWSMEKGLWVWASDEKTQRRLTKKVSESKRLMVALEAIRKREEGLSNAELDDLTSDNSNWMTLWVMRQLLSLGFVEYQVDLFGNSGKYKLTALGRDTLQKLTGQAPSVKPPAQTARPSTSPGPVASSPDSEKLQTKPAQT
ncbi:MAG: hypothetical protein OK438_01980 [Thaumarchaeota archaeon]|nr:hypothetical protein [Nitrososphaerota archaeon]